MKVKKVLMTILYICVEIVAAYVSLYGITNLTIELIKVTNNSIDTTGIVIVQIVVGIAIMIAINLDIFDIIKRKVDREVF